MKTAAAPSRRRISSLIQKGMKLDTGIQADALGLDYKLISVSGEVGSAVKYERGVQIENYDPTNLEQQQKLGVFPDPRYAAICESINAAVRTLC